MNRYLIAEKVGRLLVDTRNWMANCVLTATGPPNTTRYWDKIDLGLAGTLYCLEVHYGDDGFIDNLSTIEGDVDVAKVREELRKR